MQSFYMYITASQKNGTLYIGVTSDLSRRVYEHKNKITKGFASKYNINILVYYEEFEAAIDAIAREKQIKRWKREWKLRLIEEVNPSWKDLYTEELSEDDFKYPGSLPSQGRHRGIF